ncbi:MAG: S41 family peptidase [Calditrichia bacterium]
MRKVVLLLSILLFFSAAIAGEALFIHSPAPSPDGSRVAFSFQGDIWVADINGGDARRLTANPAYDYLPRWSPDGQKIAFSSDRYGNDDVYVMDLDGGNVERLTWYSGGDRVYQWLPGQQGILFSSRRDFYYHRMPLMYTVPTTGGTPQPVVEAYADMGQISPDGKKMLFVRGRANPYRKHYRGSASSDIYLYDFESQKFLQLTNFSGNDFSPMWGPDGKVVYYVCDSTGTYNLWQMSPDGSNKKQLTDFREDGVRRAAISLNGKVITFERSFGIYKYEVQAGEAALLEFRMVADDISNPVVYHSYSRKASEMAVSPDGEQVAFVVRGELFVMSENGRFVNNISRSAWRDMEVVWAPNSDSLVFVSDRDGSRDLYLVTSGDPRQKQLCRTTRLKVEKIVGTAAEEHTPRFSPDGKTLAYIRGKGDLVLRNLKDGSEKTILKGWSAPDYQWSPDSRWLIYSVEDNEFNSDVWLHNLQSGKRYNVSQHPDYDYSPRFSPDGRRLAFISKRSWDNTDVWMLFLRKSDEDKTDEEWEDYFENKKDGEKQKGDSLVVVDEPEKLYTRLHRVSSLPGEEAEPVWSPDGQYLVFSSNTVGKTDLWKSKWNGKDIKQITSGNTAPSQINWHPKAKKIYFLARGGELISIKADGSGKKSLSFSVRFKVNVREEQSQKFSEAWRTLNDNFYDPQFHGADWEKVYKKYAPVAQNCYTVRDFNTIVYMMLGELNASHLGIGMPPGGEGVTSGMLGLRFDKNYSGPGLKISEVLPNGPADIEPEPARVGEILKSVNGVALNRNTNLWALLENQVDQPTEILLEGKKDGTTYRRSLVVRPVSPGKFVDLEYDRWRSEKAELVHRLSDGKLGYIHIRAMAEQSLDRFEMELYAEAHGKEGLIIDVRNNGGGWTADYLLNMLMIKNHAYTIPRDGGKGYPQGRRPLYAWTKPIVTMCNEWSFSNAEIFSHAVKTLKRGKVVGYPTGGFVISTGGISLIDGSSFRVPFRGWYVKGSGLNMENNGAVPDVIVKDQPGDAAKKKDRQLEKAVEVLLQEL